MGERATDQQAPGSPSNRQKNGKEEEAESFPEPKILPPGFINDRKISVD